MGDLLNGRESIDECPECSERGSDWWVLGWHACFDCEIIFTDTGSIVDQRL